MRSVRYCVAMSVDGFIAGPHGEYDWIAPDPSFDFGALWDRFDTLLMGRRTFEVALTRFEMVEKMGKRVVVVSTTLDPAKHPGVTVIRDSVAQAVAALKAQPGNDIWLMGGGVLFRNLLDAGLVDTVELTVIPVLLGRGVPLLPEGRRCALQLKGQKSYPNGTLLLVYSALPQARGVAGKARVSKAGAGKRPSQKKGRKP